MPPISFVEIKEGEEVFKYKSTEMLEPGIYIYFNKNLPFKEDYKKYIPIFSVFLKGNFCRLAPAEDWVFNFLGVEIPNEIKEKRKEGFKNKIERLDAGNLQIVLNEFEGFIQRKYKNHELLKDFKFRNWQRSFLEEVLQSVRETGQYDKGLIVHMGGGKTLATLLLGSLGKILYIAPRHLFHTGTIKNEIDFWHLEDFFQTHFNKPFEIDFVTPESAKKKGLVNNYMVSILDECLSVKNPNSQRSIGVKTINQTIPIKIAMTGTPISAKRGPDLRWVRSISPSVPELEKNWIWLFGENPHHQSLPGRTESPLVCDSYRVQEIADFCKEKIRLDDISDILAELPELTEKEVELKTPLFFHSIMRGLLTEKTLHKRRTQALSCTSGFVYSDNNIPIWLEKQTPCKIQWIKDFLENNPEEPIVIFSHWRAELEKLRQELSSYSPAIVCDNNTSAEKFIKGETNVLICSASVTEGMNLQRSRIMIATSWSTNPTKRKQAIARVYRPGQKRGVILYNLICRDTLDGRMLQLLREHQDASDALVNSWLDKELDKISGKIERKDNPEIAKKEREERKKQKEVEKEKKRKQKEIEREERKKQKEIEREERKKQKEQNKKKEYLTNFDEDLFPIDLSRNLRDYTKVYLDVETSGLKGKMNLIQYSVNQSGIKLIRPYREESKEEIKKLFDLLQDKKTLVIGFNVGFDLGHLYFFFKEQFNNTKPFNCQVMDLWLKAIKSPPLCFYNTGKIGSLDTIPKKYSNQLIDLVQEHLAKFIPPIASIKVKHQAVKKDPTTFESLIFSLILPRKLKTLALLFLSPDERSKIQSLEEIFYLAPFKEDLTSPLISEEEKEKYETLWKQNEEVLDTTKNIWEYARFDIELLWKLENWLVEQLEKFNWKQLEIDSGDICTHIVAYTRFFGFPIDEVKAKKIYSDLMQENEEIAGRYPGINLQSWQQRRDLLIPHLINPAIPILSTDTDNLDALAKSGFLTDDGIKIAKDLMKYNPNNQRINQLKVFINSKDKRVYPNFNPVGTATGRMSGRDGLNFQGVSKEDALRSILLTSAGGDFDGLEIVIAATFFKDENLLKILKDGGDFHTMTAKLILELQGEKYTYEQLMSIKKDHDHPFYKTFKKARNMAKGINFAILYFAGAFRVAQILEVSEEIAEDWVENHFFKEFPSLRETRDKFYKQFVTADTTEWNLASINNMKDFVENIFKDRKYICLQKVLARLFWESNFDFMSLAKGDQEKIQRKDKSQVMSRALSSASFGAGIKIQQAIYRRLGNFPIQSAGAELTKRLMIAIWHYARLPMMNVHDEIIIPRLRGYKSETKNIVTSFLEKARILIPYLSMDWREIENWSQK